MRIWDVDPEILCRQHLLGEHRELHAVWSVLIKMHNGEDPGYSDHPETQRWVGKLPALYRRHAKLVEEFRNRDYNHGSPLEATQMSGHGSQFEYVDSVEDQLRMLRDKDCPCPREVQDAG